MITEIFDSFVRSARGLGDYQSMSKTELANGYCDADEVNDNIKKDQYYSALILRYWYKVKEFASNAQFARMEISDFVSWVAESLDVGFKYRRWRDPSNPLSKDPDGPDKVFNRCFFSTHKRWLTHFNRSQRRVNYIVESTDEHFELYGDRAHSLTQHFTEIEVEGPSKTIVQMYLNKGKIIEAIVIDTIAHQDSFVLNKKLKSYALDKKRILSNLNSTSVSYLDYFNYTYDVDSKQLSKVVEKLNKLPNRKLYRYINNTMSKIKKDNDLLNMLREIGR
jgi:hypothetical protein